MKKSSPQDPSTTLVFSAMSGIFPDAPDIDAYWRNILHARVAGLSSLQKLWHLPPFIYFDSEIGKPNKIYLDHAFCLPEEDQVKGRQTVYGLRVITQMMQELGHHGRLPDVSQTGLVAGFSWCDLEYYRADRDLLFDATRRGCLEDIAVRYSPDEMLNEICRAFDLKGPRISVDTACASSLFAVAMARDMILSGQARSVIVLGLSAVLPPVLMVCFSQLMALAANGKSLPFSRHACGIVPGEAACAVLLEPLADALKAGRSVLGLLRSIGLSSDGAERSIFAPGPEGQMLAYERAYETVDTASVDYIEAHGTATMLGDQTELETLSGFFQKHAAKGGLPIGSVKAIIGHTLAAAGLSSIIKALKMFEHNIIPPHIPVEPHPFLEGSFLRLPKKAYAAVKKDRPMTIGISSFGFGGSNAHLVVSAYAEEKTAPRAVHFSRPAMPQIAIVDMEAAFGDAIGAAAWQEKLRSNNVAYTSLPLQRFAHMCRQAPKGLFFPDEITIDAARLRMGPKLLSRIDPFQNLAAALVGRMLERCPEARDSKDTAVFMCSNNGGAMIFHLNRRYAHNYYMDADGEYLHTCDVPETAVEEISSLMGSMFSGYPAMHFNLRGFHQTSFGDTAAFFTSLQTTASLLDTRCRHLVLGAGHYIKTPLDLCYPGLLDPGSEARVIEGLGLFLLKSYETAKKDGDRVLAVVRAIVTGQDALHFEQACKKAGIDPASVDIRECASLQPGASRQQVCGQSITGGWYLGEATGVGALAAVLLKEGRLGAIEVFEGPCCVTVIFIEKLCEFAAAEKPVKLPLDLCLIDEYLPMAAMPRHDSASVAPPQEQVFRPSLPAPGDGHEIKAAGSSELLLAIDSESTEVMRTFLKLQKKMAELLPDESPGIPSFIADQSLYLPSGPLEQRRLRLRQSPAHIVIEAPSHDRAQGLYGARLLVDEGHSYFFDHPLDHVPGILLLEGALQLFQIAQDASTGAQAHLMPFVSQVDLRFYRWCEKDHPVVLSLKTNDAGPGRTPEFSCTINQHGERVAHIRIKTSLHTKGYNRQIQPADTNRPACPNKETLHKRREENVLVSSLFQWQGNYCCDLIAPPGDHIFADGDSDFHSMLYLLETSRQFGTLLAHTVINIPMGSIMTLITVAITLDRQPCRNEHLRLRHLSQKGIHLGPSAFGTVDFALHGASEQIGTISTTSIIDDAQSYHNTRWKEST